MPNRRGNGKIKRPNFHTLWNGITFSFDMTNHLNHVPEEDYVLKKICDQISARYFLYCEEQFPIWARLPDGEHAFEVTPQDKLFKYLYEESRAIGQSHGSNISNYVMFTRNGNIITVTHFGKRNKNHLKTHLTKQSVFVSCKGKLRRIRLIKS